MFNGNRRQRPAFVGKSLNLDGPMSHAFYRTQARLCRRRAYEAPERKIAEQWLAMAEEYEQLARSLETTGREPRTVH